MDQEKLGHGIVDVSKDGKATFRFEKPGTYYLVYKYGQDIPYLPYPDLAITIEDLDF